MAQKSWFAMPVNKTSIRSLVFNIAMARETEDKILFPVKVRAGMRAVIRHPDHGFYLVAELEGQIAGSLLVTREWSDWRNGVFWWIQSVYVPPSFGNAESIEPCMML